MQSISRTAKNVRFRSAKLTGPFVQMIYSMIAGDMIRFAIISAIFLVSFSQGLTYLHSLKNFSPHTHICPIVQLKIVVGNHMSK